MRSFAAPRFFFLSVLALGCHSAFAQTASFPEQLKAAQYATIATCRADLFMAMLKVETQAIPSFDAAQAGLRSCVRMGQADVQARFKEVAQTVRPASRAALMNTQVAFVTTLQAIQVPAGDKRAAEARVEVLKDKLNEAWARFEVEQ